MLTFKLDTCPLCVCKHVCLSKELCEKSHSPVCLFPTRKACSDFNADMLSTLDSKICKLKCVDEIDEATSSRKWDKTAAEKLKMLNRDCQSALQLVLVWLAWRYGVIAYSIKVPLYHTVR